MNTLSLIIYRRNDTNKELNGFSINSWKNIFQRNLIL